MAQAVIVAAPYIVALTGAASAYMQYREGKTQKAIAEQQAQQKRIDAQTIRQVAEFDIEQQRARVRKFKGTQKVSLLASGVTLEGTALDILADTELQASIDRDIIRFNAEQKARGLETSARISAFAGEEAGRAGTIRAGTTLLASAGKFATRKNNLLASR